MNVKVFKTNEEIGNYAANMFEEVLNSVDKPVLGLATGSSPISLYKELIRRNKDGIISFKNVSTYNLDEYYGLESSHSQSYRYFMMENLFNHVDIDLNNVNVPKGTGDIEEDAKKYEDMLDANQVDIQILGVGRNGHIAFNEPGSSFDSVTHKVDLDKSTIEDNARFFESIEEVPTQAITMGLKSIMKSKKIVLIATGESKADAINKMINGEVTTNLPASILQNHKDVTILVDEAAASLLK